MRVLIGVLLLSIFVPVLCGQRPEELNTKIRTAVDANRYTEALEALRPLEKNFPDVFTLNNFDYLAARLSEKNADSAAAMGGYQAVVKRDSPLKEYALYHLAGIARSSGNLILERLYLQELIAFSPASLLADAARVRTARSLFESQDYGLAIKALESLIATAAPKPDPSKREIENPLARENRLLLARSYLQSGNMAAARGNFTKLLATVANPAQPDDFALAAVKALDSLDAAEIGKGSAALSDSEHLRRAAIYQFNRDFADARVHYNAIITEFMEGGNAPDAIYQIGRGYVQDADVSEAIRWFERVLQQFPESPTSKDALLQLASAYARVGRFKEAAKRYHDYIDKYPDDERVDRAYLNIIDVLRDEGEEPEALKWAAKVQEVFRGKTPEALALFAETRIRIADSDWAAALSGLDKLLTLPDLGGVAVPGGTNRSEVMFLRAFVLEQLERYSEAVDAYLSIPDGRGEYYGGRATDRLQMLSKNAVATPLISGKLNSLTAAPLPKDTEIQRKNLQSALRLTSDPQQRSRLLESLRKVYAVLPAYKNVPAFKLIDAGRTQLRTQRPVADNRDPHLPLAGELLFLGLYDEAAPEFDASRKNAGDAAASDAAFTKAYFYKRGDMAYRAVVFAEPLWKNVPGDYQVDLIPLSSLEMLYPAPYADAFAKNAVPRGVDPRFLLSIVRQESRYQPNIKSYAAARGLMQFISSSSSKIALELGRTDLEQDELYDPSTAILFGSQYVADLFKLFPNQPEAVAASYNGGEDNMKRWMKRSRSELAERYVPEIAFSQSKDYVYKVMANYRIYQMLYDEKLGVK